MKDFFLQKVTEKGGFKPLHLHLDKSNLITPSLLEQAQSVSMQDKWLLFRELKKNYTYEDIYLRAEKSLKNLISQDISIIRTFVDADKQIGQMCIDAIRQLKEDYKNTIEIEIAIQPLEGVLDLETRKAFTSACSKADIVGGLPSRDKDEKEHLRILFDIAKKYNLPVDVHVDQLNSPYEKETELLLDVKKECNFKNRTNAVHSISLSCNSDSYQEYIAKRLYDENIGVIICPSAALSMKPINSLGTYTRIHNSIAPIMVLKKHNVKMALGIDNIHDLFMPIVDGDMWFECRLLMEATRCYDLDTISTIATNYI